MKKIYLLPLLILSLISCVSKKDSKTAKKQTPPNIIYVLVDDMGIADIGPFGQEIIKTPELDGLAQEGMVMTNHYCGSAVCAPSRCTLITGKHTGHSDIRGNKERKTEGQFPIADASITVAECLKKAGYATGVIGKWGLGYPGSEGDPLNQGFDFFYGYNCQRKAHTHYPPELWKNDKVVAIPANQDGARGQHSHELLTKEALGFIENNAKQPFFLYLAYIVPHANLEAPEKYMKQYSGKFEEKPYEGRHYYKQQEPKAAYAAMVSMMDADVGAIKRKVQELGLGDNTIIIFTSDNGPHTVGGNDPEFFNSNGVYRGYKRDLYEGGIRSPFIAWWPGKIKAASTSDHIATFWDFLPTACDLASVNTPSGLDGISYAPTLLGTQKEQEEHTSLYWEFHEQGGKQAVRMGKWKAVRLNVNADRNAPVELYDLSTDIGEITDVSSLNAPIVREMSAIMDQSYVPSELFPFRK